MSHDAASHLIATARPLMLERANVVEISGDEYRELKRKAAAYDAGVQGWGIAFKGRLLPFIDEDGRQASDDLAAVWSKQDGRQHYKVVPVRIVEASQ